MSKKTPEGWRVEKAVRSYPQVQADTCRQLLVSPCRYCEALPRSPRPNVLVPVDPALGLVTGNVVPVCRQCHRAKGKMPEEEFIAWVRMVELVCCGP
jgi:hypothetical protein